MNFDYIFGVYRARNNYISICNAFILFLAELLIYDFETISGYEI